MQHCKTLHFVKSMRLWKFRHWAKMGNPDVTDINPNFRGGLIIKRASETSTTEATNLTVNVAKLAQKTTEREEAEKKSLMEKYNLLIEEYNKMQQNNVEL